MNNGPIFIAGIDAIAQALGLSPATLEKVVLKRPDFSAAAYPAWTVADHSSKID